MEYLFIVSIQLLILSGVYLKKRIDKLDVENKNQQIEIKALQVAVQEELSRIDDAVNDMFEKRTEDLYKQDNLTLAERAKIARQKFNKGN